MMNDTVIKARDFANQHHGEQRYGDRPYAYHLDAVVTLLEPYGESAQVIGYLHDVVEDTVVTQEQMLEVLNSVLDILTFAVGALGGISLVVGGVGILTIMTIAVKERTSEIGLLNALGAKRRQVLLLFLSEAMLLSIIGGLLGLLLGWSIAELIHQIVPAIPVHTPWHFALLAVFLAMIVGLLAGVMPARKAAAMNPVDALRTE